MEQLSLYYNNSNNNNNETIYRDSTGNKVNMLQQLIKTKAIEEGKVNIYIFFF